MKKETSSVELVRRVALVGVITSVVAVILNLWVNFYFQYDKVVERKTQEMAEDYYENYFYDNFLATLNSGNKEVAFEKYETTGFAPVLLRQLLLFDGKRNQDYMKHFDNEYYYCDVHTSRILFYPVAPYGRKDYRVEQVLTCNYK